MTAFFQKATPQKEPVSHGETRFQKGEAVRIAPRVLLRAHVTEKAGRSAALNQYVFVVAPHATKSMIAQAVFEVYGVRPVRVQTIRIAGKRRRLGASEGRVPGYRKAMVTLPHGKTIEVLPK